MLRYDSDSLTAFIDQLQTFSTAVGSSDSYCRTWVPVTDSQDGIITDFCSLTSDVQRILSEKLAKSQDLIEGASVGVRSALTAYTEQRIEAVDRIEQAYGEHFGGSDLPITSDTVASEGVSDPSTTLTPPSDESVVPDLFYQLLSVLGISSTEDAIVSVLSSICPLGPMLDELYRSFAGDWNIAARSSNAIDVLRQFMDVLAEEMNDSRLYIASNWDGVTADSVDNWMRRMVASLDEFHTPLRQVSQDFRGVSAGMQANAALAATALGVLSVLVIVIVVAIAAAPETGGLSLLGVAGSAAAAAIQINSVFAACALCAVIIESTIGLCGTYLSTIFTIDKINKPGTLATPLSTPDYSPR
jgi:hypothetical protein